VQELIQPLFREEKASLTVYEVKKALKGAASDAEIREALRGLEDKGTLRRGVESHNRYVYSLALNPATYAPHSKKLKTNKTRKLRG